MVDTLVKLIVNIEEGWGEHFIYDVMPLKQKRPDLFPMVLAAPLLITLDGLSIILKK